MTQTYTDRVTARPGYATYKNRKKELRRQLREGRITEAEHAEKRADAAAQYAAGETADTFRQWHARAAAGRRWLDANPGVEACGDDSCPAATGPVCVCRCGGANHGIVAHLVDYGPPRWTPPMPTIAAPPKPPCTQQPDLFFPPPNERSAGRRKREAAAKAICASCPDRIECRDRGRERGELGIWGGETELERHTAGHSSYFLTLHIANRTHRP